jgi:hypothetical protein
MHGSHFISPALAALGYPLAMRWAMWRQESVTIRVGDYSIRQIIGSILGSSIACEGTSAHCLPCPDHSVLINFHLLIVFGSSWDLPLTRQCPHFMLGSS